MTTQPPQQPGHAHQPGFPQQPGLPQPPVPPKKRSKARLGCLGVLAVIVIGGIASVAGSGSDDSSAGAPSSAASTGSAKGTGSDKDGGSSKGADSAKTTAPRQSTVDAFKAYVKKHESAKTQEAATHVTKVQGADENNDILDTADIYTDYTGDMISADAGNAKLLASAFADFQSSRGKDSKNGLVTVYNADGDLLGNGNY
ncbi:hypothetical protein ACF09K_14935 [Streptomyces sp. NPDC014882]|uniref:hypothetical protein n=1 Tax=Streptomyces sp. NPDC014882 TaxID=3364927 RepID=UPI0036F5750D